MMPVRMRYGSRAESVLVIGWKSVHSPCTCRAAFEPYKSHVRNSYVAGRTMEVCAESWKACIRSVKRLWDELLLQKEEWSWCDDISGQVSFAACCPGARMDLHSETDCNTVSTAKADTPTGRLRMKFVVRSAVMYGVTARWFLQGRRRYRQDHINTGQVAFSRRSIRSVGKTKEASRCGRWQVAAIHGCGLRGCPDVQVSPEVATWDRDGCCHLQMRWSR